LEKSMKERTRAGEELENRNILTVLSTDVEAKIKTSVRGINSSEKNLMSDSERGL